MLATGVWNSNYCPVHDTVMFLYLQEFNQNGSPVRRCEFLPWQSRNQPWWEVLAWGGRQAERSPGPHCSDSWFLSEQERTIPRPTSFLFIYPALSLLLTFYTSSRCGHKTEPGRLKALWLVHWAQHSFLLPASCNCTQHNCWLWFRCCFSAAF
jgi:hypothetical protein